MLGPLKLRPILKEKVWGGDRLAELAGKHVTPGARIGESWELVDRADEESLIADGPHERESLTDLLKRRGDEIYGSGPGPAPNGRFPLLIKFIDAAEKLSVQVHPDDAYVREHGLQDMGKSECWYILDAPDEGLIMGLKEPVEPEALREAVRSGRIEEILRYQPIQAGELAFCPAGTVHSITPPTALVEIQQNSDLTYRLYDWHRVGLDGRPRELHVDQAIEVVKEVDPEVLKPQSRMLTVSPFVWEQLVDCDKFAVSRWQVESRCMRKQRPDEFEILICIGGAGRIRTSEEADVEVWHGDTVLIPACLRDYAMAPQPKMTLLHAVGKE